MGKHVGKERPSFIADLVENNVHEYTPTHTHTPTDEVVDYTLPPKKERRSHRLNMFIEPSKVKKLKVIAKKYDVSMSDIINGLIDEFLKKNE